MTKPESKERRGNSWARKRIALIVGVMVLVIVVIVLGFVVVDRMEEVRNQVRAQGLRNLGSGLRMYSGDHSKRLPAAVLTDERGEPAWSWRVLVRQYCESGHEVPTGRWGDTENADWLNEKQWPFCLGTGKDRPEVNTNIVGVTGKGTAFQRSADRKVPRPADDHHWAMIVNVAPHSIIVIEIHDSGIHWMEPRDIDVDELSAATILGERGKDFHVLFADGAIWHLKGDTPFDVVRRFCLVDEAAKLDRNEELGEYVIRRIEPR